MKIPAKNFLPITAISPSRRAIVVSTATHPMPETTRLYSKTKNGRSVIPVMPRHLPATGRKLFHIPRLKNAPSAMTLMAAKI